jgi:vacuolar-type H+-ATPase subunit F/Vma7
MSHFLVITRPDLVDGFRLAGVDAFAVNSPGETEKLIAPWLEKSEELLIALDDGIFSKMNREFIQRLYACDHVILVTIPDGPMHGGENTRKQRLYEMIRHSTGIKFSFKGEEKKNG